MICKLYLQLNWVFLHHFAGIGANPDLNDSSMNTAWVVPGGLGLQRDYYLDQDEKTKEIRGKYVDHVARMLQYIRLLRS